MRQRIDGIEGREAILRFIQSYQEKNNYPPTYREIAEACDYASVSTVAHHLYILEQEGLIKRPDSFQQSRSIQLTDLYYEQLDN